MFAAYALRPIWDVFEGVDAAARSVGVATGLFSDEVAPSSSSSSRSVNIKLTASTPGMDTVAAALSVGRTSRAETPEPLADVLARFSSAESVLRAVLRRYRPLSDAVLDAACDVVPSPKDAAARRHALRLIAPSSPPSDAFERIQNAVTTCDPDALTAAHACRFFVTDRRSIGGGGAASGLEDLRLRAVTLCDSPRGGPASCRRRRASAHPRARGGRRRAAAGARAGAAGAGQRVRGGVDHLARRAESGMSGRDAPEAVRARSGVGATRMLMRNQTK